MKIKLIWGPLNLIGKCALPVDNKQAVSNLKIKCYGSKFGRILAFFGIAKAYQIDDSQEIIYLNKTSFKKWMAAQNIDPSQTKSALSLEEIVKIVTRVKSKSRSKLKDLQAAEKAVVKNLPTEVLRFDKIIKGEEIIAPHEKPSSKISEEAGSTMLREVVLNAIEKKTCPELKETMKSLLEKFQETHGDDLISSWKCDEKGNFQLTLKEEVRMWYRVPFDDGSQEKDAPYGIIMTLNKNIVGILNSKDKTIDIQKGIDMIIPYELDIDRVNNELEKKGIPRLIRWGITQTFIGDPTGISDAKLTQFKWEEENQQISTLIKLKPRKALHNQLAIRSRKDTKETKRTLATVQQNWEKGEVLDSTVNPIDYCYRQERKT